MMTKGFFIKEHEVCVRGIRFPKVTSMVELEVNCQRSGCLLLSVAGVDCGLLEVGADVVYTMR